MLFRSISWELALFSVLFLPVVALIIGSIVKRLRHPARTSQQRMGELVSTLDESLSGIKVIKSYNAVDYIKQKFYDLNADLARLTLSMARRQQLASPRGRPCAGRRRTDRSGCWPCPPARRRSPTPAP